MRTKSFGCFLAKFAFFFILFHKDCSLIMHILQKRTLNIPTLTIFDRFLGTVRFFSPHFSQNIDNLFNFCFKYPINGLRDAHILVILSVFRMTIALSALLILLCSRISFDLQSKRMPKKLLPVAHMFVYIFIIIFSFFSFCIPI